MEARVSEAKGTVAEASRHPWGNKVLYQWGVFDVAMLAPWEKKRTEKKENWPNYDYKCSQSSSLTFSLSGFVLCAVTRSRPWESGVRQSAEWNAVNESGLKAHEIFCHYMTDAAASVQRQEAKETSAVALMQHSSVGQNTVLWLVGVESQKCCWAAKSCKARTKYIPTKRICFTWKVVIWTWFAKNEKKNQNRLSGMICWSADLVWVLLLVLFV